MCLLDNEKQCTAGTMRPTGDYGSYRKSDGRLCYIGRMDKQIKRLGHKINLDHIQQVNYNCNHKECVLVGIVGVLIRYVGSIHIALTVLLPIFL